MKKHSHIIATDNLKAFMLGGKAVFTIKNTSNDNRFTYKITIPADKKPETTAIYFVKLMTGPDNQNSYKYIGYIRQHQGEFTFFYGDKSKISQDAKGVVAFDFVFREVVIKGRSCPVLEVWHEGSCCRCGRPLTVPESIASGIGPECARIKERKSLKLSSQYA